MKPMVKIHDMSTGEVIEREMNAAEFKQYEADQVEAIAKAEAVEAKASAKAALLDRLGISVEEAKLLLS
jgi:hypothetical protein